SNSTLSGLMFNSETKELGFTVTGPTGTTGFTNVIIPKSLLSDISTLAVYVDETEMNYSAESQDDVWEIFFTYEHSTHQVVLNLQAEPTQTTEPEPENQEQEQESFFETPIGLATIVGALVAAAVAVTVLVMRRRQNNIQQK
ncbi:MAG: hypothetical protein NWF03_08240, partial [Candidatus Bathyarchaeota archaeon]|nr:hypothetical protein [Candidatus Bathyarchaeota archaeon]